MTIQATQEAAAYVGAAAAAAPLPSGAAPGARADQGGAGARSRPQHDEVAALAAIASGATHEVACRLLGVSSRTMRRRVTAAVEALGATCPTNAIYLATLTGLLRPDVLDAVRAGKHRTGRRPTRNLRAARLRDYARARAAGLGPNRAAAEIGISSTSARHRYETAYREQLKGAA